MMKMKRGSWILALLVLTLLASGCWGGKSGKPPLETNRITLDIKEVPDLTHSLELRLRGERGREQLILLQRKENYKLQPDRGKWTVIAIARNEKGQVIGTGTADFLYQGEREIVTITFNEELGINLPCVSKPKWSWQEGEAKLTWELPSDWHSSGSWQIWYSIDENSWEFIGEASFNATEFPLPPPPSGSVSYGVSYKNHSELGQLAMAKNPPGGVLLVDWEIVHDLPPVATSVVPLGLRSLTAPEGEFVDLIAHFTSEAAFAGRGELLANAGLKLKRSQPQLAAALVEPLTDERSLAEWSTFSTPDFYLEPNWIITAEALSLKTTETNWYLDLLQVPRAQDITRGDHSVHIAVLDTGIDSRKLPRTAKILAGYDFINGKKGQEDDNYDNSSGLGHGTAVSSLITAVMPQVSLVPVKVLDAEGRGSVLTVSEGLLYAAGLPVQTTGSGTIINPTPAHIINLSLGQPLTDGILKKAVAEVAKNTDAVMIAAAGNHKDGIWEPGLLFPGAYSETIAVGSIDLIGGTLRRAYYSHFGPDLDLVAPADEWAGTSFSTAFVSGIAGLMLAEAIPPREIREVLKESASDLGSELEFGAGLVNANWAVRKISRLQLIVRNKNKDIVAKKYFPLKGQPGRFELLPGDYTVEGWINVTGGNKPQKGDYFFQSSFMIDSNAPEPVKLWLEEITAHSNR